jgi:hypothetical protein
MSKPLLFDEDMDMQNRILNGNLIKNGGTFIFVCWNICFVDSSIMHDECKPNFWKNHLTWKQQCLVGHFGNGWMDGKVLIMRLILNNKKLNKPTCEDKWFYMGKLCIYVRGHAMVNGLHWLCHKGPNFVHRPFMHIHVHMHVFILVNTNVYY